MNRILGGLICLFLAFPLFGCTAALPSSTSTALPATPTPVPPTLVPSPTLTVSLTSTLSQTLSPTPLPTASFTPTPTLTPTFTPTRTPSFNLPGLYNLGACLQYLFVGYYPATWCITSVEIRQDGKMVWNSQLTITWKGDDIKGMGSDKGNWRMYLTDDLGNRYDTLSVGGDLGSKQVIKSGDVLKSWYLFDRAWKNARFFTFHDDNQKVMIGPLWFAIP